MKKRYDVFIFIENLLYIVNRLKWKISNVNSCYCYLQKQWIKNYVESNQRSRQSAKNAIESSLFKNLNNTLYGSLIVDTDKPEIKLLVDANKEYKNYYYNVLPVLVSNPFASSECVRNLARKIYEENSANCKSIFNEGKIEEEYNNHMSYAMILEDREKRSKKSSSSGKSSTLLIDRNYCKNIEKYLD